MLLFFKVPFDDDNWKNWDSAKNAAQLCAVLQSDKCSAVLVFENYFH